MKLAGVSPLAQVAVALIISTGLLVSLDWLSALVAFLLEILLVTVLLTACARVSGSTGRAAQVWAVIRWCIPVAIAAPLVGVGFLLYGLPSGQVYLDVGWVRITDGSITLAVASSVRMLAIGLPTALLMPGLDATDVADGLAQRTRLPTRFVLGALAAARLMADLRVDWTLMSLSRRARGIGDRRLAGLARVSFGLLVLAIRRATKLAVAMEARGFGGPIPRTWARPALAGRRDRLALTVATLVPVVAVLVAAAAGTFRLAWT